MSPAPRSYPFAIANAFTRDPFGGNPATIIFLDPSASSTPLTHQERLKFSNGFNQPIIVFLTPTVPAIKYKPGVASFDIQFFTPKFEVGICGHGTVAAMKIILDSATNSPGFGEGSQFPSFAPPETHTVEFTTPRGVVISARKVVIDQEVWFEIILPAAKPNELPAEKEKMVRDVFARAMGREPKVKYIGTGGSPYQTDLLVVLEESENLEQLKLDTEALKATGFIKHIVTTESTSGKFPEDYIIRMFAPSAGIDEDHVCGSANGTAGPYWAAQKGITELKVRQVSERGGQLRIGVCDDTIKLRGQARVTSVGQLFL